jgi:ankyrin repeat protein
VSFAICQTHTLAVSKRKPCGRLLIQSGANVNAVDKDGWTPLHAAAHWEQEETCRILAENGASFEMRNYSVLIRVVTFGETTYLEIFFSKQGSNVVRCV